MRVRPFVVPAAVAVTLAAAAPAGATPTASVTATPDRGQAPLAVTLDGSGSTPDADPIVAWHWNFGDGSSASTAGPTIDHEFAAAGVYTVKLRVEDDTGELSGQATASVRAQALTLALTRRSVVFGGATSASGTLAPAESGVALVIEQRRGGSWHTLAAPTTTGAGSFGATLTPKSSGRIRARIPSTGAASAAVGLAVLPRLTLTRGVGRAFLGAPLTVRARPLSYGGRVTVTVRRGGRAVGRASGRVRDGRLRVTVPTPGLGRFSLRLSFAASGGMSARSLRTHVRVTARTLGVGSRGADVRALLRRLAALRYHVPRVSATFGWGARDAVVAFQKGAGLGRTGVVGASTWQALGRARVLRPRFARPAVHIEVDKTRQLLLVVRRGRVSAVIQTSTGATGNTPEGRWRIYLKAPGYNAIGMYYSMFFKGNFAVHGYASVPPYPASHGCARLPIWTAYWLYRRSEIGETVYVYR